MSVADNPQLALFRSVAKGDCASVLDLLRQGMSVNCKDEANYNLTPLIRAAWSDNDEMIRLLIARGATLNDCENQTGATALHIAAQQNNKRVAKALIDAQAHVDAVDKNQQTPLMACAALSHLEIGQDLLRAGADTDLQQSKGFTALHFSVEHNHVDFARLLVQFDAKLDVVTKPEADKHTAFTMAALLGHLELLQLLSIAGANIHMRCSRGGALELAKQSGVTEAVGFVEGLYKQRQLEESTMSIPRQPEKPQQQSDGSETETSETETETSEDDTEGEADGNSRSGLAHSRSSAQLKPVVGQPVHRVQSDRRLAVPSPNSDQQHQQPIRRSRTPENRQNRWEQRQQQGAAAVAALAAAAATAEQQQQQPRGHRRQISAGGGSPAPPAGTPRRNQDPATAAAVEQVRKLRVEQHQQPPPSRQRSATSGSDSGGGGVEGISSSFRTWKIKRNDKPIGSGSFGVVYRAFTDKNQFVAVKVVKVANSANPQQLKQAIRNEEKGVRLLSRLNHRNILRFLKTDRDHLGNFLIFTELLSGNSLTGILEEYGVFTEDGIINFTRQICSALDYIHTCNPPVLHRDLKCSNVMLTNEGIIKLIDFGLAKEILTSIAYNPTGIVGTPCFIAPEILDGRHFTDKSDIWSLGCTLFEMATGSPPNADKQSVNAVMFAICNKPMPKMPVRHSRNMHAFYDSCVQKQPQLRLSAGELLNSPLLKAASTHTAV